MANISIDKLYDEIQKTLTNYSEEYAQKTKKTVDKAAKECRKKILKHITFNNRTGNYIKSFRVKQTWENKYGKGKTWYVANRQHGLTHLLEHGHKTINGKYVKAYPHIKYGEEIAIEIMKELEKQ